VQNINCVRSIEPNTGHLRHAWKAFLQPNSRVCRSSHASPVAYRVEQYFIVRAIPIGDPFVRLQSKVDRANCTGCVHRPAWSDRSRAKQLSAAVSRDKSFGLISDDLRSYPSERATGSLRSFLLNLHNRYTTITCVCQARIQRRVLMSIPPSRGRPRLFEELPRHDEIRGGCSRVAREPVLPRSRLCPVQSFEGNSGSRSGPRQHAVQRLLSGARVRKVQSGQGVSRESIIGLAIGLSRDCLTSLRGTCAGQARACQLVSLPKLTLLEPSADPRSTEKGARGRP
jgi:hypothetical protein